MVGEVSVRECEVHLYKVGKYMNEDPCLDVPTVLFLLCENCFLKETGCCTFGDS